VLNAFLLHPICRRRLSEVTTAHFAAYRDEKRLRELKPASVKRQLGPIHHLYEVARDEWSLPIREAAHRMLLPASGLSQCIDRRAAGVAQHLDCSHLPCAGPDSNLTPLLGQLPRLRALAQRGGGCRRSPLLVDFAIGISLRFSAAIRLQRRSPAVAIKLAGHDPGTLKALPSQHSSAPITPECQWFLDHFIAHWFRFLAKEDRRAIWCTR